MSGTLTTLGDCCRIVSGSTPDTGVSAYWGGDIYWATPKDLSELSSAYIENTPRKLTKAGLDSCSAITLPVGSVLFSSRAPIGHVAINTVPMCTNQGFKSFVPDAKKVFNKYLYYWLKANKEQLQNLGNGATFKEVSKATVSAVQIFLPSLDEQRRLAAILDKADALLEKRRQAINKLDTLVQSIFLDMFGDPMKNQRQWDIVSPQDVASSEKYSIAIGPFGSSLLTSDYRSSGVPLVFVKNIRERRFNLEDTRYVTIEKAQELGAHVVRGGDILMTKMGDPPGDCAIYPLTAQPAIITADCIKLTLNQSVATPQYIMAVFDTAFMRREIQRAARGVAQQKINLNLFKELAFPLPPIDVQRRFSHRVKAIESLRGTMEESTTRISNFFLSIQQHAFNGELFNGKALASLR